ncbi:unnamed protein product [Bathycoccus prasinos]
MEPHVSIAEWNNENKAFKIYDKTSKFEKYNETIVDWSGMMYQCDNIKLEYKLIPVNVYTPMDMRAPGGATADPLDFRLINYADSDQNENKPHSSKELRECYRQACDSFGWKNRYSISDTQRSDNVLVGYGMATGCWEAMQQKSSARAELSSNGKLIVSSSTADIGTGSAVKVVCNKLKEQLVDLAKVNFPEDLDTIVVA